MSEVKTKEIGEDGRVCEHPVEAPPKKVMCFQITKSKNRIF
jgi:hypothetical protein